ncbi:unnamed protein product [Zymoseptoria tritici ST99CH_1E4]|uniref:Uncharacterized protein n=1 Tax=Zymoseptoria tritici ST99CH_1E4 TaxID=1276532 RepID=A0A2H1H349_ZYMTR|nr:unnamed protein product [Zymoseptoria tritici ST99CH_1E4]
MKISNNTTLRRPGVFAAETAMASLRPVFINQEPTNERMLTIWDIPAEVRNIIYAMVLTSPLEESNSILTAYLNLSYNERRELTREDIKREQRPQAVRPLCSQLLRASRQVNQETTPVLYGTNLLSISVTRLQDFLNSIGSSIKYLREIEIELGNYGYQSEVKAAVNLLSAATALRSLKITYNNYPGPRIFAKNMARDLKPFVQQLIKARASRSPTEERASRKDMEILSMDEYAGMVSFSMPMSGKEDHFNTEYKETMMKLLDQDKRKEGRKLKS